MSARASGAGDLPEPGTLAVFVPGAASPVDLKIGPGGDLFYADLVGGTIRRISYSAPAPTPTPTPLPDADADGVPDGNDNCPYWPNPGQSLPPWPTSPGDDDCDGSTMAIEEYVGTDPFDACGADAWPPDTDDNGFVSNLDILLILTHWFETGPNPPYVARADIFNGDGTINNLDILPILNVWLLSCT